MNRFLLCAIVVLFAGITVISGKRVITGDERTELYLPLIEGKRVALYSNHTGIANDKHVVDLLIENRVNVVTIFSPEHGFRGNADAGEKVGSSVDEKTGIPICSLYGSKDNENTAPDYDVLLVDIQDVGLRFYTYYVTIWKLMNRCAKSDKEVIVLDRPNPNGFYVDGPILDMKFRSGVGWLPIPIVYGMTLGELAQMINGENWLDNGMKCKLKVIPCKNYSRKSRAQITVPPSPNLPNMRAIYLYPSTCFFEGTVMSLGRGTSKPFQIYGHPDMTQCAFAFIPQSRNGAKNPPLKGKLCYGKDLTALNIDDICKRGINLGYVIDAYENMNIGERFFTNFFDLLAGTDRIRKMITSGYGAKEIEKSWKQDVKDFKKRRKPYLIYR